MAATVEATRRYVSIGVAAGMAGCSPQALRDMEKRGEIPPAARVEGLGRRFYDIAEVERIRGIRRERAPRLAHSPPG